jgi:hypothetical protein
VHSHGFLHLTWLSKKLVTPHLDCEDASMGRVVFDVEERLTCEGESC